MASVTGSFTVVVAAGVQPLAITPNGGNLPGETQGVAADDPVCTITGGVTPYKVSVSSGSIPPGMSLSLGVNADGSAGVFIEGTPTQSGAFSFGLTVTDSAGATATATVGAPPAAAPPAAPAAS